VVIFVIIKKWGGGIVGGLIGSKTSHFFMGIFAWVDKYE